MICLSSISVSKMKSIGRIVVSQEKYDKIVDTLNCDKSKKSDTGGYFKYWSNKHFKIEKIGSSDLLYCRKASPVAPKENIYDTLLWCHERVKVFRQTENLG